MVKSPTPLVYQGCHASSYLAVHSREAGAAGGLGNKRSGSNVQSKIANDLQNSVQGNGSDERLAFRVGPFEDDIIPVCIISSSQV